MALRWRLNGELLCAAKHDAEEGDTYIDDRLHYQLAVQMFIAVPDADEKSSGKWHWRPQLIKESDEYYKENGDGKFLQ